VIVSIDGEAVEGPGGVMRAISQRDEGEVEITVIRDKKRRTITATLEKAEEGEWQGSAPHMVIPEMPDVEIRAIPAERMAPTAL